MQISRKFSDDFDELNLKQDQKLRQFLSADEFIIYSSILTKINKRDKRQDRTLMITSQALYNLNRNECLANTISKIYPKYQIRRKIELRNIDSITISTQSGEFLIHVKREYDYRYSSPEKRAQILNIICKAFYIEPSNKLLTFYFTSEASLSQMTTTEDDLKRNIIKSHPGDGIILDEENLASKLAEIDLKSPVSNFHQEMVIEQSGNKELSLANFEILSMLGRGAFGKVMLVEDKTTKKRYAIKSMSKDNNNGHAKTEKLILEKNQSPFIVKLESVFLTSEHIMLVLKFMAGGELYQHLKQSKIFEENRAKFYTAELILAIEYLHASGVVYRDLKPENVLLDEEGHICLSDFGMSKILKLGQRTTSFVGTPNYLAPEIVANKGYSFQVDWWALGVLTYEMLIGLPPFYRSDANTQKMFSQIREKTISFSTKTQISDEAKSFISSILDKDPESRLGAKGVKDIKDHPWFSDINWTLLASKQITPPFRPILSQSILAYFDPDIVNQDVDSLPESNLMKTSKGKKDFLEAKSK